MLTTADSSIFHALCEVVGVAASHDQSSAKPVSVWRNVFFDPSNGSVTYRAEKSKTALTVNDNVRYIETNW
jgi:hypothetical protein